MTRQLIPSHMPSICSQVMLFFFSVMLQKFLAEFFSWSSVLVLQPISVAIYFWNNKWSLVQWYIFWRLSLYGVRNWLCFHKYNLNTASICLPSGLFPSCFPKKRPPPVYILGQPNSVHISTFLLLEIHSNIIKLPTPKSPQWSLSLLFPQKDTIKILPSPTRATCPAHLIPLDFINRTILGLTLHNNYLLICKDTASVWPLWVRTAVHVWERRRNTQ